jgi:hypothetical protein
MHFYPPMGSNRRKMEDERRRAAEKEAASRRTSEAQVLEDAERLIAAWNERQVKRMPMLFSPTIVAAITARYWFLWVHCPACRTINAIDLRTLDLTATRPCRASFPLCLAGHVGRTHHLPSWCGYHERASPTKCATSIAAECLASRAAARLLSVAPALRSVK